MGQTHACSSWPLTVSSGIIHIKKGTIPSVTLLGKPTSHFVKGANGYLHPGDKTQAQVQLKTRFPRLRAAQTAWSTGTLHVHRHPSPIRECFKRQNGNNCKYINHHVLTDTTRRSKVSPFTNWGAEAQAIRVHTSQPSKGALARLVRSAGCELCGEGI